MVWGKLGIYMLNNEIRIFPHATYKTNFKKKKKKQIKDLNVRTETMKLLKKA